MATRRAPRIELRNEGSLLGYVRSLDIVGTAIAGSVSGSAGTITLSPRWVELEDFGGAADGTTNNTTALNSAVTAMASASVTRLLLRPGTYRFTSKPSNFTTAVEIIGSGISQTTLVRDYTEAGSAATGFLSWVGSGSNGSGIRDCQVAAATGTTGGNLLAFKTNTDQAASFHFVDNVACSFQGTGTYVYALYCDGRNNDVSGSQGLRDFRITRSFLFLGSAGTECAQFDNCTNLYGSGLWANGDVNFVGGGTALQNSTDCNMNLICLGQLFVSNTLRLNATGITNTLIFSTGSQQCQYTGIITTTSGGYGDTGTTNRAFTAYEIQRFLIDGVTAPSTVSGFGQLYIDTADGDLKVKFGDGTVKTITTDT
jgi:hypothetical protein